MKTKSLFFAALIIVSAVVSAAGKDEPRRTGMVVVPVKGSEIYKLVYKGESVGRVKLNIYNQDSKLILTETINKTDGFICPLNFKGLDAGTYTVEILDGTGKKSQKITVATKATPAKMAAEKTVSPNQIHVSKLKTEDKYLLSVMNSGIVSEEIYVKIFDEANNLIHAETKTVQGDFAVVYKLISGSTGYTFEVSDKTGKIKTARF